MRTWSLDVLPQLIDRPASTHAATDAHTHLRVCQTYNRVIWMWRATVVWHPKHPEYEQLQPCRIRNIPNEKSYSRVVPKHPECEQLRPCSTRNIQNVKSYSRVEPETSRMWTATTMQNPKHPECEELQPCRTRNIPNVNSYNHSEAETSRMWKYTTMWNPYIPNVNSYSRVAPQTST